MLRVVGRGRRVAAVVLIVAMGATAAAGCGAGPGSKGVSPATAGAPQALTGNELRYGASPRDDGTVRYQPDVVILGGGADSVRSVSSDGMVWTIDGRAKGASDLRPGQVLFATSLGAGRVLAIDDVGADLRVALGPIAITDLIRDAKISSGQPVPVSSFDAYNTPDRPGLQTDDNTGARTARAPLGSMAATEPAIARSPVRSAAVPPSLPPMNPPSPKIPGGSVGGWNVFGVCCTENGVHVSYDNGGARVSGTATIAFSRPSVDFSLTIGGGHLVDASVRLNGAATLAFDIEAAVKASASDVRSGRVQLPVSINVPIPIAGIPFNVSFQQLFEVNLGLSGEAFLSTSGAYRLGGSLGFSVQDGTPRVLLPTLTTTKSALDNIQSLAVAPQGLTFAFGVKVMIGIGVPGLSAGIWYQISAGMSLATSGTAVNLKQTTSLVPCKTVSLAIYGRYGVGYQIPSLVAKAINLFLGLVMRHPPAPVQPNGGPSWGPTALFKKSTPPCTRLGA
jgi:hypothetical protein